MLLKQKAILLLLMVMTCSVWSQEGSVERRRDRLRAKERQNLRGAAANRNKEVAEVLENLCYVENPTSAFCVCDSLALQDATSAKCYVFNVTSQNDLVWSSFRTQSHLQELSFNLRPDGRLNFVPTVALQSLANLTNLEITNADIQTIGPQTFANSTALQLLTLKRNQIHQLKQGAFDGLDKLMELTLSHNALSSIERGALQGLAGLKMLYMDNNSINLIEEQAFLPLGLLHELDLSLNNIGVLTPDTLAGLNSLQVLSLRNNSVAIIGDRTFVHVPNLRHLDLSNNLIQLISDHGLVGLSYLNYVNLQNNQILQLAANTWVPLAATISYLNLKNNELVRLDKEVFVPLWTSLVNQDSNFYVQGNPLVCDCQLQWIESLQQQTQSTSIKNEIDQLSCTNNKQKEQQKLIESLSILRCLELGKTTTTTTTTTTSTTEPSTTTTTTTSTTTRGPILYIEKPQQLNQTSIVVDRTTSTASVVLPSASEESGTVKNSVLVPDTSKQVGTSTCTRCSPYKSLIMGLLIITSSLVEQFIRN